MVSGGLSRTDVGRREVIDGMALEFYWHAGRYHEMHRYLRDIMESLSDRLSGLR
jgi:hypothetical protein